MFLFKWVDRGLGQIVAPDDNYVPSPDVMDEDSARSDFWLRLAPEDPDASTLPMSPGPTGSNTSFRSPPPDSAFQSPSAANSCAVVKCEHCLKLTPIRHNLIQQQQAAITTPDSCTSITAIAASTPSSNSLMATPVSAYSNAARTPLTAASRYNSNYNNTLSTPQQQQQQQDYTVEWLVLQTAKGVAQSMTSPTAVRKLEVEVLDYCLDGHKFKKPEKHTAKFMQRLQTIGPRLFHFRSSLYKGNFPDGYTPLMAAAFGNNVPAAELLLKYGPVAEQLQSRNLQGKTAFHIASERGNVEMVQFLLEAHRQEFGDAAPPIDLVGHTPFAAVMTSPEAKARTNRTTLKEMLYQATDVSILGSPTPAKQRMLDCQQTCLNLIYAFSEKPGQRILMEDAMLDAVWSDACLLGVCDGHSDGGQVSQFLAQELPLAIHAMRQNLAATTAVTAGAGSEAGVKLWEDVCLNVDSKLQATTMAGGSTAVLALITADEIIVANVGDSRCILIQQSLQPQAQAAITANDATTTDDDGLTQQMATLSLQTATSSNTISVKALSNDHKPELPTEKARIEAAGLTVKEERYTEKDGVEHVIHKVALTEDQLLATSRAFGDFEYKANTQLSASQQAVIAVPEVLVHRRSQEDAYLVLACDGIWDVMSNEAVGQFIVQQQQQLQVHSSQPTNDEPALLADVADQLLMECLRLGSTDNMSVMIVALGKTAEKATVPERKALNFDEATDK